MGARPDRPRRGRHASSAGLLSAVPLPALGLPVAAGRHGRASHGPASAALVVATVGGVLTVAGPGLSGPVAASAASHTVAATAPTPVPLPAQTVSAAALEARQELADRATRSARRAAVVATPFRAPATSTPVASKAPVAAPPLLPGCTARAGSTDGYANGRLPARLLCDVGSGERLRADAARAYAALAVAYESRFGREPCLIDGYRTLGEQQVLRRTKRRFAAPPGTSEHGWGLAVDLGCGVQSRRTVQHAWVAENGPRFGWVNPEWARAGGAKPEPWHWEYAPGQ